MRVVELVIPGQPYSKARPRVTGNRGAYTPKEQKANEEALAWDFRIAMKNRPFPSNVAVELTFYRSNRQRIDLDNLVKQVLDSANEIAWKDDAQVTTITARLHHDPENPRTLVTLRDDPDSSMLRGDAAETRAICEKCGAPFTYRAYPSLKPRRRCTKGCAHDSVCTECGCAFRKRSNVQVFCGQRCAKAFNGRKRTAQAQARPKPSCAKCGVTLKRTNARLCRACWLAPGSRDLRKRDIKPLPVQPHKED